MRRLKVRKSRNQQRFSESQEIELLEQWIEAGKPDSGTNPLAVPPPPPMMTVGRMEDGGFFPYAGCTLFRQLPISRKTKEGLAPKYKEMSEIQRASLPHSLCGRDILGAAKTGSGKTLAFIIPVIEKLYRARWGPEDGVGSIIISPTKELAGQLFEELKIVGKRHTISAGLLIGGRKDVDTEKECVNFLNILVCTPGRLLQHMNETPNFECSQLQVLVLDEADRMPDKKIQGLSLKDPEYISVHAESVTATPERLKQIAMEVSLDQKLNALWSFIKSHLHSKMIVFLSSCKQVRFVYEAFKKLRPGIPLKCLHGRMKQNTRMAIYLDFCETNSVLFSTDVASRGLDFPAVDWVIQVDCPEDVAAYIHRVGRTARFTSEGKSVLFLLPSEMKMLAKLQSAESKIPIKLKKVKSEKMEQISGSLASLLVKYPDMQQLAKRAFVTYVKSVNLQKDKEVFDVFKLPLEDYSASLGLAIIPKIRFISQKMKNTNGKMQDVNPLENAMKAEKVSVFDIAIPEKDIKDGVNKMKSTIKKLHEKVNCDQAEEDILVPKNSSVELDKNDLTLLPTRVLKKKKLKINVHRPLGTRLKYDDNGNQIAPLAAFAVMENADSVLQPEKVKERYEKLKEEMKQRDKEDKILQRQRLREKRMKDKIKLKRWVEDDDNSGGEHSLSDDDKVDRQKNSKVRFASDSEDGEETTNTKKMRVLDIDAISLAEQEALALKLLSSMHS
ncbi:hypothetical protein HPP92_000722 [Vanilla planifolia]|uniref:ATP-dependent RNA helicase n=1 Tax=Vanilla planifolia TaxID=51239 RepID=A0A835VKR1_VANPL|nr:hypothetical protein HPP92_000722 [Vanilla planifolia]